MNDYLLARIKSFGYAFQGIFVFFKNEAHAKIHLVLAILAIILGIWLKISQNEWLAVILSIALVISLEMINSAIEKVVDLVSPGFHPLAGKAKDIAAGAVLVAALATLLIGLVIFFPKIFIRLGFLL
jgi:undecaprenol kinase